MLVSDAGSSVDEVGDALKCFVSCSFECLNMSIFIVVIVYESHHELYDSVVMVRGYIHIFEAIQNSSWNFFLSSVYNCNICYLTCAEMLLMHWGLFVTVAEEC